MRKRRREKTGCGGAWRKGKKVMEVLS